jgi:hypothetical protein
LTVEKRTIDSRGIPHLPKSGRYGAPIIRYRLREFVTG